MPAAKERRGPVPGLGAAMMKLASSYSTEDLALIEGFLESNLALLKEQISKLD
jgi:hypothetical protein